MPKKVKSNILSRLAVGILVWQYFLSRQFNSDLAQFTKNSLINLRETKEKHTTMAEVS